MPIIDKEPKRGAWKFVRDGDNVAYDDRSLQHCEIADQHHLGQPNGNTFLVDDAGLLSVHTTEVTLAGGTLSLRLRESSKDERENTATILRRYTTKEVILDQD